MNLRDKMLQLEQRMNAQVLGQENVVRMLLIALLCDGHILLEGLPGLAKTRAVRELARHIAGEFRRIQFTPDLLPSDITGSEIYQQNASREEEQFRFRPGPVFGNVILADEINRASARVQSALLEAMEERHVTVAGKSWPLPGVFMVLATQNPVDQEGTWPLPEAQLDRFLMKVQVDYPSKEHERQVMQLVRAEQQVKYGVAAKTAPAPEAESLQFSQQEIASCWQEISAIHVAPIIETWIVELVNATRQPQRISEQLASYLAYGLSPRGTLALERCARAQAWLAGRDAVRPEDVRFIAPAVMRHRLMLSYQASADGCSADDVITMLLNAVMI
ncbi:AAA family ATPase [Klebsiella aerogenes]|uniref:AAA family ATPase n=1 Tax=Klebsiella aerogenes TaxID=548 RepID=UPI001362F7C8|nr:MoxR family ATPase [Klebsiella aerogenes]EMF0924221.1 MoxR family ATPase [Klebsiella aerogenes]QHJ52935.1 AAA domain-containing protein [Klebsiella aerogenes]HBV9806659.1 MoxR family ATPase [Klebsiella aerogenes]HDH0706415.1 MoxR family ATPase [Klebsiella aerogenes]HDT2979039.1 MoxR family ATPase [Klebsiella aerogenes]